MSWGGVNATYLLLKSTKTSGQDAMLLEIPILNALTQ